MWFDGLASIAFSVLFALLFFAIVATAISGPDHRSSTRVGEVVMGILFLALLMAGVRWAVRTEHRLRDGEERPRGGLPGHAELPGSPFKGAHTWIMSAVIAVVCDLFTALLVRGAAEQRVHRQARLRSAQQTA